MKCSLTIFLCFFVITDIYAQPNSTKPFKDVGNQLRTKDDATNFIYAHLDTFLINPTEERITILTECERALWRQLQTNDEWMAFVILQCNKGYYLNTFGDINKAVEAYETAWMIYDDKQLEGFDIIEYCLKPLGNSYSILGDYQSAANIIKHYLYIAEKENSTSHLVSAFINLSIVYHDTGRQMEAITLLKRALAVKGLDDVKKGLIASNLARNLFDLMKYDKAEIQASAAIRYLTEGRPHETASHLVNTLKILSLLKIKEGKVDEALTVLKKAQSVVEQNPTLFKKRELAKLLNLYAEVYASRQNMQLALKNYQQSLMILLETYPSKNLKTLPNRNLLYPENALKETFDGLGELYSKNNTVKALECFELSFVVDDLLRQTYHYQEDKLQQQIEVRNRTEKCLDLLFHLYQKTKDERYANKAFALSERTKAVVLKEAIGMHTRSALIKQDTLLTKHYDLTFKKASLSSDLLQEQSKGEKANIDVINELISRQTQLSIQIREVQQSIARKYPQYNSIIDTTTIDIIKLQKKLEQEEATLIEYAAGKNAFYVFVIDYKTVSFYKVAEVEKLNDHLRKMNNLFASPSEINNNIDFYKQTAYELCKLLHIPTSAQTKNLAIVTDGLLNYLPFEALLFEESNSVKYQTLPYLLKKFIISYQPSTSTFLRHNKVQLSDNNVLAVFPVFRNSSRTLTHSEEEAKSIQSHLKGRFLFETDATKKAFTENIQRYNIIHLSTHAAAGSWLEPPSIEFIDSTLYLPEVYGLKIQPDLIVLSACETGVGENVRGEGTLSLARGFQYAGANNIIFSLWKVNDRSTAMMMSSFYKRYFEEQNKAEALRHAKLEYLENAEVSNAQKSPYYWAPFVYYGDISNDAIDGKTQISWTKIMLMATVFLFVILLFLIMRRKSIVSKT